MHNRPNEPPRSLRCDYLDVPEQSDEAISEAAATWVVRLVGDGQYGASLAEFERWLEDTAGGLYEFDRMCRIWNLMPAALGYRQAD